jgi:erythrocyte band 7 integral membrane protein
MGRIRKGGPRGPGIFFVMPCIDNYRCVDLRTITFDVPAQEVSSLIDVEMRINKLRFMESIIHDS